MIPLWAIGAGLSSVAAGLGYGLAEGKRNTVSNPYSVPNNPQPTTPAIDLLNDHVQREQQRIRADISGDLGLTPEWVDRVAVNRADDSYKKWLMNSNEFELHGAKYKWMEENSPAIMQSNVNGLRGKSNSDIAALYAKRNHRDGVQYQGSYQNLINEKQRLTGKRYIPVRIS